MHEQAPAGRHSSITPPSSSSPQETSSRRAADARKMKWNTDQFYDRRSQRREESERAAAGRSLQ
jgi:hypothetical protein